MIRRWLAPIVLALLPGCAWFEGVRSGEEELVARLVNGGGDAVVLGDAMLYFVEAERGHSIVIPSAETNVGSGHLGIFDLRNERYNALLVELSAGVATRRAHGFAQGFRQTPDPPRSACADAQFLIGFCTGREAWAVYQSTPREQRRRALAATR